MSLVEPMTEGDDAAEIPPPSFAGPGPSKSTSPFVPNREEVNALKEGSVSAKDTALKKRTGPSYGVSAKDNVHAVEEDQTARILAEAHAWIGTPYQHQASLKGVGCDCIGLIRGVWRALYGVEPQTLPPYSPDWAEVAGAEVLVESLSRHFKPVTKAGAGDVLVFRLKAGAVAKHAAILLTDFDDPRAQILHAYWGHAVVRSWLRPFWHSHVAAAFRFP